MKQYKVLIVEDDAATREKLAEIIKKEGFEVTTAGDGKEGLKTFKKDPADIVITDLKMPHIEGLEVMHATKRLSPNCEFIVVTAYGETDTAISALREGALDYLEKPLDLGQLMTALGRAKERIAERGKAPFFPNVLLAEDEDSTREHLARELEKEGWKVIQARDGEEAYLVL